MNIPGGSGVVKAAKFKYMPRVHSVLFRYLIPVTVYECGVLLGRLDDLKKKENYLLIIDRSHRDVHIGSNLQELKDFKSQVRKRSDQG